MKARILRDENAGEFEQLGREYNEIGGKISQILAKTAGEMSESDLETVRSLTEQQMVIYQRRLNLLEPGG